MSQQKTKMIGRLTEDQHYRLTPIGREMHEYWMKYRKKMYKELADSGELYRYLKEESDRLSEMIIELMQNGLYEWEAKEIVREEIYDRDENGTIIEDDN